MLILSRPARGAWIEMLTALTLGYKTETSRPARGAWIEIFTVSRGKSPCASRPARGAWIEMALVTAVSLDGTVAPRKGRVD